MRLLVFRAVSTAALLTLMFSLACSSSTTSTMSSTAPSVTFSPTTLNFSNQAAWDRLDVSVEPVRRRSDDHVNQ